jgi:hypothetical protein
MDWRGFLARRGRRVCVYRRLCVYRQILLDDGFMKPELSAVACRLSADFLVKDQGKLFGVGETGSLGDDGHWEIGVGEHFLGGFESYAADFLEDGAAEGLAEVPLEGASIDASGEDDFPDADVFAGMVADEPHGGGDVGVVDGEDFGGGPGDDADGGEAHDSGGGGRRRGGAGDG